MAKRSTWMMGLGAVVAVGAAGQARAANSIPVVVNGTQLSSDAVMIQNAGRTVLPMRTLFESLGAHVEWDPSERAVYAWRDDQVGIRLALGDRSAQTLRMSRDPRPGSWGQVVETHPLEAPATMIGGRIFVPIRFAAESLNASVRFLSAENRIYINTQNVANGQVPLPEPPDDRVPDTRRPDDRRIDDRRADDRRADDRRTDDRRVDDRRIDNGIGDDRRVDDRRPADRNPDDRRATDDRRYDDPKLDRDGGFRRAPNTQSGLADTLDVTLEVTAARVRRGDSVPLRLVVRNTSNYTVSIPARTQQFDFQVMDRGRVIWSWMSNRTQRRAAAVSLKPGEEMEFSGRWSGTNDDGEDVAPGDYTVRGIFYLPGRQPRLVSEETITVR